MTADDVKSIRSALDGALFIATSTGVVANIYDLNSTTVWAIYFVQWAHTQKVGDWTVESAAAQQSLSFQALYEWLEGRHSLHQRHNLTDSLTNKVVHRYVLPLKRMKIPPDKTNMFKFRKGANRLSEIGTFRGCFPGSIPGAFQEACVAGCTDVGCPSLAGSHS